MRVNSGALAVSLSLVLSGMVMFGASPVQADADLEERVAELEATTARKGNRKVSLTVSGQVTGQVLYWDDGVDSDLYITDSDGRDDFGTQFNFWARARTGGDYNSEVGSRISIGVIQVDPRTVTQNNDDGNEQFNVRYSYVYGKNDLLGQLSIGLNGTAMYGITEIDLSSSQIATGDNARYIESFNFRGPGGVINPGWVTPRIIYWGDGEFDRGSVIRYDTPSIAGFTFSASWGEDDVYDAALRYAGEFGGIRVAAGVAYGESTDNDNCGGNDCEVFNGSASIQHTPTGLFLSGSWASQEVTLAPNNEADRTMWNVKAGISAHWNSLGKTTIWGEYHYTDVDDFGMNTGGEGEIWGVGLKQRLDAAAMELYLGYRHYDTDLDNNLAVEDFSTVIAGARIRF